MNLYSFRVSVVKPLVERLVSVSDVHVFVEVVEDVQEGSIHILVSSSDLYLMSGVVTLSVDCEQERGVFVFLTPESQLIVIVGEREDVARLPVMFVLQASYDERFCEFLWFHLLLF